MRNQALARDLECRLKTTDSGRTDQGAEEGGVGGVIDTRREKKREQRQEAMDHMGATQRAREIAQDLLLIYRLLLLAGGSSSAWTEFLGNAQE